LKTKLVQIPTTYLLFIGITLVLLGAYIIIFDYMQLQYFDSLGIEYQMLDQDQKEIHQRLQVEFAIGIGISAFGAMVLVFSLLRNKD